jgi:hypothetical protein
MCLMLHFSNMERIRNERPTMHASIRRERMVRNEAEGRVGRHNGRGRGRCVDGSGPSKMNEPEPQPKQYHMEKEEIEVENADDDEKLQEEVEPQPMDDNPSGPHELFVLTIHHVHVARSMMME